MKKIFSEGEITPWDIKRNDFFSEIFNGKVWFIKGILFITDGVRLVFIISEKGIKQRPFWGKMLINLSQVITGLH